MIKKLERFRRGLLVEGVTVRQLVCQLEDELADVVICADLVAAEEGIDLGAAIARKWNRTSQKMGLPHRIAPSGELVGDEGVGNE